MTPDLRSRAAARLHASPDSEGRPPHRLTSRRRWTLRLVLIAGALVVLTLIAAANFVLVELRLLVWHGEIRLPWLLLIAVALGFGFGLAVGRRR